MVNWQWLEVCIETDSTEAETLACLLDGVCRTGPVIEQTEARCCVKVYFPRSPSLVDTAEEINRFLEEHFPHRWAEGKPLKEEDWAQSWKAFFTPMAVGKGILVKPSWVETEAAGKVVVELDPGTAFGTGQHPTTRMCLRELEARLEPGTAVLDLGTGSGILAIAAAKLGAGRVLALDIDPAAVSSARENIQRNRVEATVAVGQGGVEGCPPGSFDLVLANISSEVVQGVAAGLARVTRPGGVLIASGFTANNLEGVSRALAAAGWEVGGVLVEEGWHTVVARKE